jgi:hypothetical protein
VKVENSIWRCTFPVKASITGTCDALMVQQEMEKHLKSDHGYSTIRSPMEVLEQFVLIRTAEVPRGPGRRGKVEDETLPMFEKGKDSR